MTAGILKTDLFEYILSKNTPFVESLLTATTRSYRVRSVGVADMIAFQPYEVAKPFLFSRDKSYFSIFGDGTVAEHICCEEEMNEGKYKVIAYGRNYLYLHGRKLPPTLHSAGIDLYNRIWLVSDEGWLTFFDTNAKTYLEGPHNQEAMPGTLIPRDNQSLSLFIPSIDRDYYTEMNVVFADKAIIKSGMAKLPSDVQIVLYSDEHEVVYVTETHELLSAGVADGMNDSDNKMMVYRLQRGTDEKPILIFTKKMKNSKKVYEGVYLPHGNQIFILAGFPPEKGMCPFPNNKPSWKSLRLVIAGGAFLGAARPLLK